MKRIIALYAVPFVVVLSVILFAMSNHMTITQWGHRSVYLVDRITDYRSRADKINMIFFGDSRTYCGIHPEQVDPLLGTHSLNMAMFGMWFPTQHAFFIDLIPILDKDKVVVWSIGFKNFFPYYDPPKIHYPLDLPKSLEYLSNGYSPFTIMRNFWNYSFFDHSISKLKWNKDRFFRVADKEYIPISNKIETKQMYGKADVSLSSAKPVSIKKSSAQISLRKIKEQYKDVADIKFIQPYIRDDKLNSVALIRNGGGHYRIELNQGFYRAKQEEHRAKIFKKGQTTIKILSADFSTIDRRLFNSFISILDLFKKTGKQLIVNELEEAPYTYKNSADRELWRDFMRDNIRPLVEARGFTYINTRMDELSDSDYFDYNHLNSNGVDKYSKLLAEALKPHIINYSTSSLRE
jgi:hypothetical protein